MNEELSTQEEHYSSDVSEHSISTPLNNVLNSSQNDEKEQLSISSSSKPNPSKAEKVITLFDFLNNVYNL